MIAMDTDKLIERLAENADPVRRLAAPWVRTAMWIAISAPYVALVVAMMAPRSDLQGKLTDFRFLLEQVAALSTGISAATNAFISIVPGYDRRVALISLAPLCVWLASLADGCIRALLQGGAELQ